MTLATRAIGYIRVSTDEQANSGVSLAAQEAKVRAYCDLYEIQLAALETDAGFSAKSLERPGLQRALAAIRRGEANALVIFKLDRLTRSVRDLGELLDDFQDERRALLSVNEQLDTRSAAGRLVLRLLTSVAEWEREVIAERTATAMRHLAEKGRYTGGRVPYGYELGADGETLLEVEAEQVVMRLARELRAQPMSLRAIADTLERRGHRSRAGTRFSASAIAAMLGRVVAISLVYACVVIVALAT